MGNNSWLNEQGYCAGCGWKTFSSPNGIDHVCNDATCLARFYEVVRLEADWAHRSAEMETIPYELEAVVYEEPPLLPFPPHVVIE